MPQFNRPDHTNVYPTFHVSELKRHVPNNAELYPSRELQRPGPIVTKTGTEEWEIEKILDKRTRGRGCQYLVRWQGYGPEVDVWVLGRELENTQVLQEYQIAMRNEEDASKFNVSKSEEDAEQNTRIMKDVDAMQDSREDGRV